MPSPFNFAGAPEFGKFWDPSIHYPPEQSSNLGRKGRRR